MGHQGLADLEGGATVLTGLGSFFFGKFIQVPPVRVPQGVQTDRIVEVEHSGDIRLVGFGRQIGVPVRWIKDGDQPALRGMAF